ncbi:hypothetical protein BB559_001392 [Furculomyces boomerangus]|uniref:Uncharacterized protein n=2 Tax=Harpellales TaxID=61421 RepID=A0A2T9Z253_9FUNG|nr:hypothetical protein BB559_001392 [Furculomyces boomerangus]PVZ98551.1 hypothetical protein BB558_005454 [Smittium angustum]
MADIHTFQTRLMISKKIYLLFQKFSIFSSDFFVLSNSILNLHSQLSQTFDFYQNNKDSLPFPLNNSIVPSKFNIENLILVQSSQLSDQYNRLFETTQTFGIHFSNILDSITDNLFNNTQTKNENTPENTKIHFILKKLPSDTILHFHNVSAKQIENNSSNTFKETDDIPPKPDPNLWLCHLCAYIKIEYKFRLLLLLLLQRKNFGYDHIPSPQNHHSDKPIANFEQETVFGDYNTKTIVNNNVSINQLSLDLLFLINQNPYKSEYSYSGINDILGKKTIDAQELCNHLGLSCQLSPHIEKDIKERIKLVDLISEYKALSAQ